MSSRKAKPKPPADPAVAPARRVWVLMPGAMPVELGRRRRSIDEVDGATHWAYEGDQMWRPIATLFAKGG